MRAKFGIRVMLSWLFPDRTHTLVEESGRDKEEYIKLPRGSVPANCPFRRFLNRVSPKNGSGVDPWSSSLCGVLVKCSHSTGYDLTRM